MSVLPLIMASQSIHVIHLSFSKGKNNYEISPTFCALLLIIIFLLVFMLVCHICMCNHRDEIGDLLPTNQNRALSWMRSARGLDAATIGGLPTFFYKTSVMSISSCSSSNCNKSNQEAECCICLGSFEEGDKLKVLPGCHHGFHSECVDRWLRVRSSCPLCRASVLLQDSNGNSSMAAQGR